MIKKFFLKWLGLKSQHEFNKTITDHAISTSTAFIILNGKLKSMDAEIKEIRSDIQEINQQLESGRYLQ